MSTNVETAANLKRRLGAATLTEAYDQFRNECLPRLPATLRGFQMRIWRRVKPIQLSKSDHLLKSAVGGPGQPDWYSLESLRAHAAPPPPELPYPVTASWPRKDRYLQLWYKHPLTKKKHSVYCGRCSKQEAENLRQSVSRLCADPQLRINRRAAEEKCGKRAADMFFGATKGRIPFDSIKPYWFKKKRAFYISVGFRGRGITKSLGTDDEPRAIRMCELLTQIRRDLADVGGVKEAFEEFLKRYRKSDLPERIPCVEITASLPGETGSAPVIAQVTKEKRTQFKEHLAIAVWDVIGLPDSLRNGALILYKNGGICSYDRFREESFGRLPSQVFDKTKWNTPRPDGGTWKGWIRRYIKMKSKTVKLVDCFSREETTKSPM